MGGQNNPVVGAIEAIAVHPSNANTVYVAGVNGGVWRTNNALSLSPSWTPLGDQLPSLSGGDIEFSPLDATGQTLFYGVGAFSSGGLSGSLSGLFRTTDGGATWVPMDSATLAGQNIRSVVPTSIGTSLADQVVLVAARGGGLFRSDDGGANFDTISGAPGTGLPGGDVSHLVADPANNQRYYAALPGQGIFISTDGGQTWGPVNNGIVFNNDGVDNDADGTIDNGTETIGATSRIELSVHNSVGNNAVYAALVSQAPNDRLMAVFRSADQGANWTQITNLPQVSPGRQATTHLSIAADPADPNGVYIAGDRQAASPFVANMFRGDASSNSWASIVLGGSLTGGAPHADSRDMVFSGGTLIESDDGGIYRNVDPGNTDVWVSMNGNLRPTEFYSVDYDSNSDVAFGGTQDGGSTQQNNPGAGASAWNQVNQGDGNTAAVFNGAGFSVRYMMGNNFGTFNRLVYNAGNAFVSSSSVGLSGLDATDSGFTGFSIFPYETNRFDSNRIVIGGNSLYESTDRGDNLTILNTGGRNNASAMAYGGRLGGANNNDVLYAGIGGALLLRTTSGGALNNLAAYPGGSPNDIILDSEDWRRVYVNDGSNIFFSPDAGTNWQTITNLGNLDDLTDIIQSLDLFDPNPAAFGDEVLLAGGRTGVFRTRDPLAADPLWTEVGGNLPNVPAQDLHYNAAADVLLGGTWGRGAWTVANAADFLDTTAVLIIDGDEDFPGQDDIIKLIRDPNNNTILQVFINNDTNVPDFTVPITAVEQINVNGLGGNDTLIVDSSNGLISVPLGIRFDGGTGFDLLRLEQTGGDEQDSDTYSVGPDIGDGTSTIIGDTGEQRVQFFDLEPVIDLVPSVTLVVNATPEHNAINYTQGSVAANGLIAVDNYEAIEFSNKDVVTINAGVGNDVVNLNNSSTPADLDQLVVNAAEGDDVVTTLAATTVALTVDGGAGNDRLDVAGSSGASSLTGGSGNDTLVGGSGGDTLRGGTGEDQLDGRGGNNTLDGGTENDTIVVTGTSAADTISTTHTGASFNITGGLSAGNNTISSMERVAISAGSGADAITLHLSSAGGLTYTVLGGDPIAAPGDSLTVDTSANVTYTPGPQPDEGTIVADTTIPTTISFDEIESLSISGGGGLVLQGTNGPDAITIIARSDLPGTNGVQDFTVNINGTEFLFINTGAISVDALGGSDEITLRTPASNNADWNVDVTIQGGAPSAASDRLVIETPGAGAETVQWNPTGSDSGTMSIVETNPADATNVSVSGIELLIYDGEADNDSLTVNGSAGDDTFTHTPGAGNDEGTLRVNTTLAMQYQNLGTGASLTAAGGTGSNTLIYNGTSADDQFTVAAAAADVNLNSRLALHTSGFSTLTLEGLDGSDRFTLAVPLSASPFSQLNFKGGNQGGLTGDRVDLSGTGGNDDFVIHGQDITLGAVTASSDGVEDIRLGAAGGSDEILYNAVDGRREDIVFSSSSTPGTGKLAITLTGLLVNFTSVETVEAGAGSATDGDTLTFEGTNDVDVFTIDLEADGTDADPVLALRNAAATTLLILRNYTGFETLNVRGLDGEDDFNVFTGPVRGRFVSIDGGTPTGKKKLTDDLFIFYTPPRPRIVHSTETQNPQSGLVDLLYDSGARSFVKYADIEQVVIRRV
jgi:hypothetical protein